MKVLSIILCFVLGNTFCRELHPIDPNSDNNCFDSYPDIQPIDLSNLTKACVDTVYERNNCPGIYLTSNEVILLDCNDSGVDKVPLRKGCYNFIKQDSSEDIICQRFIRRRRCEVIKTPAKIAVEVFCERTARGIIKVEKLKLH